MNWKARFANLCLLLLATGLLVLTFSDSGRRLWQPGVFDPELRAALSRPLRLELQESAALAEIMLALRTFHYRAQSRSVAVYRDVFYDTPDWLLHRSGYSYRFRERTQGDGSVGYSLRFEQEPRFVVSGAAKVDFREGVPAALGGEIAAGAWALAIEETDRLESAARLATVLGELAIAPRDLRPRLVAELRRERFEVTDKGRSWFELDHELWEFRPCGEEAVRVRLEDAVIDTRLNRRDQEFVRRVGTLRKLADMIHGVRPTERAPHERAIEALGGG